MFSHEKHGLVYSKALFSAISLIEELHPDSRNSVQPWRIELCKKKLPFLHCDRWPSPSRSSNEQLISRCDYRYRIVDCNAHSLGICAPHVGCSWSCGASECISIWLSRCENIAITKQHWQVCVCVCRCVHLNYAAMHHRRPISRMAANANAPGGDLYFDNGFSAIKSCHGRWRSLCELCDLVPKIGLLLIETC